MSHAMISASARVLARAIGILGQERRLGMRLVQIFDDGERLDQRVAGGRDQNRHPHLRIDRAEFGPPVVAAVLDEMNGDGVVGEALETERDAHAVSRRRAEIGIELHVSSWASLRFRHSGARRKREPGIHNHHRSRPVLK